MASIVRGQIDLLLLQGAQTKEMEDEDGNKAEYICIPIDRNEIKRYKTKAVMKFSVVPRRYPLSFSSHFVAQHWSEEFRKKLGCEREPVLGNAMIKFAYYEQKNPEPFKISSIDDAED